MKTASPCPLVCAAVFVVVYRAVDSVALSGFPSSVDDMHK